MTSKHIQKRSWVLLTAGLFIFIQLFSIISQTMPAHAADTIVSPEQYVDQRVERWFHYRSMRACMGDGTFKGKFVSGGTEMQKSDINDGKIFNDGVESTYGYLTPALDEADGNDGKAHCDVRKTMTQGATVLGFSSPFDMMCKLDAKLDAGGHKDTIVNNIGPNNGDCAAASSITIKSGISKGTWQGALTDIVTDSLNNSGGRPSYKITDDGLAHPMKYWIGKRSLEVFCGKNTAISASGVKSGAGGNNNVVSVDYVDPNTGKITKSVNYYLNDSDRNEDNQVKNVIYDSGDSDGDGTDVECKKMAQWTRDESGKYSDWINDYLNTATADDVKSSLDISGINTYCLAHPPTGSVTAGAQSIGDQVSAGNGTATSCVTTVTSAVDSCKNSSAFVTAARDKELSVRYDALKACIKGKLPADLYTASNIANITSKGLNTDTDDANDESKSCEAGNGPLGWITCTVLDAMDSMMNALDEQVSNLLFINQDYYSDDSIGGAWRAMRNLAYIILIPIMMVMVIGTALGSGLFDAYTVKKALPRMVAAVIFIALSLPITQLGVRISNSVGNGVGNFMIQSLPEAQQITSISSILNGSGGSVAVGQTGGLAVLAAAGVGIATAFTLGSFALVVIVGLLIGFATLVMRQVLIISLIVVAPIAILAWIFPGNDKIWNIWKTTFIAMLMMYPLISLLIASGKFVAGIAGGS